MSVDVVAIGAHPDDVEMTVGGTIAKLVARGRSVAIIDLTRGELGTLGSPELRAQEAAAAAKVLGVTERINLDMGDGHLEDNHENRSKLITQIRRLRPKLILANYWEDLHPDHCAAGNLVRNIMYPTGFANYPAEYEPYRPKEALFYMQHFPMEPSFIVDITGHHDTKIESVKCYGSQLHFARVEGDEPQPKTWIGDEAFLEMLEARARYFGSQIRRMHGEPLLSRRPVPVDDPVDLYEPFFGF